MSAGTALLLGGCERGLRIAADRFREAGLGIGFADSSQGADSGEARDVVAIVVDPEVTLTDNDLDRFPRLQVVVTASIGHDHLAVPRTASRGVSICNVPDYCVEEVADSTIAMLLDLLRRVTAADRDVQAGEWRLPDPAPRRIAGTRLGLVGFGTIARRVAARALALGIEVSAADPATPEPDPRVPLVPLPDLLRGSDALSIHVPLSAATRGLIGSAELELMPAGSVLVNSARGELVDVQALCERLERGRLAGAALDVLPEEPPGPGLPRHRNLIVTPHSAWYTPEAEGRAYRRAAAAVLSAREGKPLNRISPEDIGAGVAS